MRGARHREKLRQALYDGENDDVENGHGSGLRRGLPLPRLSPSQQRYADEPSKDELGAVLFQVEFTAIHGSVVGIEYVSPGVPIVGPLHVAYDDQTQHGLVFAVVGARRANPAFGARHQAALDSSEQFSVLLIDAHDGPRLAGFVVESLPLTDGRARFGGGRQAAMKRGHRRQQERYGKKRHGGVRRPSRRGYHGARSPRLTKSCDASYHRRAGGGEIECGAMNE